MMKTFLPASVYEVLIHDSRGLNADLALNKGKLAAVTRILIPGKSRTFGIVYGFWATSHHVPWKNALQNSVLLSM